MRTAFKEWAVICRALTTGRQTVILRKGGIVEDGGAFKPDHADFLLFPTYLHQSPANLVNEAQPWLAEVQQEQPAAGTVTVSHYATVASTLQLRSLDTVKRIGREHIWSDAVVEERFHRWGDAIYVMIVRVFALPSPVTIALRDDYAGCKSWVELADDVPTDSATPVLDDATFNRRAEWIREQLRAT